MLSTLARLALAPGICSPPSRDWLPLRVYALHPRAIGSRSGQRYGPFIGPTTEEYALSSHLISPQPHELRSKASLKGRRTQDRRDEERWLGSSGRAVASKVVCQLMDTSSRRGSSGSFGTEYATYCKPYTAPNPAFVTSCWRRI
eukprot:1713798-Pyramimonas_sp.AAC.1